MFFLDPATCMYHTGIDPMSGDRQPQFDADVREALRMAGRADLIGDGAECLIPARPPAGARKRRVANGPK